MVVGRGVFLVATACGDGLMSWGTPRDATLIFLCLCDLVMPASKIQALSFFGSHGPLSHALVVVQSCQCHVCVFDKAAHSHIVR